MATAGEALGQQSEMQAALDAGLELVSAQERVEFERYAKVALAMDGFVFWVATGEKMTATGSLHYATDRVQDEDQTIGANQIILSSEQPIAAFNVVDPQSMWIGSWPLHENAPPLQVAFAQRGGFYEQAKVWHYSGFAVYPALQTQLIKSAEDLPAGPIVSNSLPIWLAQNSAAPVYPSFLVPDNISPPYIVAHIDPNQTEALAAAPYVGPWPGTIEPNSGASPLHDLAGSQLMRDEVTLTLYGFSNAAAWQYLVSLYEASADGTSPFGFANSPAIRDAKRAQVEIATLAQKKTIHISANYYQGAADVVARRLILEASVSRIWIDGISGEGEAAFTQVEQTMSAIGSVTE